MVSEVELYYHERKAVEHQTYLNTAYPFRFVHATHINQSICLRNCCTYKLDQFKPKLSEYHTICNFLAGLNELRCESVCSPRHMSSSILGYVMQMCLITTCCADL